VLLVEVNLRKILNWRTTVGACAITIVVGSVLFIYRLSDQIAIEETSRIRHYGLALENLANNLTGNCDLNLASAMTSDNKSIPVILADAKGNIADSRNVQSKSGEDLKLELRRFAALHPPIVVDSDPRQYIYYGQSKILKQLRYFPLVLFGILSIFSFVVWYAYRSADKALQNKVWVGMSKETAHQLGTPLMSIMAWVEYLKETDQRDTALEMQKDVDRLQLVADRFGKIGSVPQLLVEDVTTRIRGVVEYMQKRSPKNVKISLVDSDVHAPILINGPLFDWVVENLIRNSLDALEGKGNIEIHIVNLPVEVIITVRDDGKGMTKAVADRVFKPGFSTKSRGWGLGLSLAKRIIRSYHHGTIEVAQSAPGMGTTFKITLRR
jgi:signal transduction histidine kinase